jgi:ubiquinone/menaquinone biosynthesis C-methylase UbiE
MDIGTGKGFLAIELARMKLDVVSVDSDADEQALADMLAREAGVEGWIRFVKGDAAHLSHPDGCFGCAAMMDVLHHLENPDPVLLEMARVVWPEGLIVLAELDRKGFEFVERVHREEGRGHPNSSANLDQAVEKLTGAGFQCLKRTNGCMRDVAVLKKGRLSHG